MSGQRATNRSEHVSSENPGTNIPEAPRGEVVINPRRDAVGAKQGSLHRACREQPLVQRCAAHAERSVDVLIHARSISV
jgi:hypothetical protein